MSNPWPYFLFNYVTPFKRRVFCFLSAMDVVCVCIALRLSLSQEERNVLLNPAPELLSRAEWKYCHNFNNHLNQLTFIGHDLSKPTTALLKRDPKLSRHSKEIRIILWAGTFSIEAPQEWHCRQQYVNIIKHKHSWKAMKSPNDTHANWFLHLKDIATVIYLINTPPDSNDQHLNILYLNDHLAREMMHHDEIHYCLYARRNLKDMRTCDVQKEIVATHRRIREIRHEYYFMSLTHEIFPAETLIKMCSVTQSGRNTLRLLPWLNDRDSMKSCPPQTSTIKPTPMKLWNRENISSRRESTTRARLVDR